MYYKNKGMIFYTPNEKAAIVNTIVNAYFPFRRKVDLNSISFSIEPYKCKWLKLIPFFTVNRKKYNLVVFSNNKKYDTKVSREEKELLMTILMGYDLYVIPNVFRGLSDIVELAVDANSH